MIAYIGSDEKDAEYLYERRCPLITKLRILPIPPHTRLSAFNYLRECTSDCLGVEKIRSIYRWGHKFTAGAFEVSVDENFHKSGELVILGFGHFHFQGVDE